MHSLEIIIRRNDYAAGREHAHAANEGCRAAAVETQSYAWWQGFNAGQMDDYIAGFLPDEESSS